MMVFRHQTSRSCHWHPITLEAPQLLVLQIAKTFGAISAHSDVLYPPIFLLSWQADPGSPDHSVGLSTKLELNTQKHSPSLSLHPLPRTLPGTDWSVLVGGAKGEL